MLVWLAVALAASGLTVPPPGRQEDFARAAREYGLPVSVLLAVSYLESRWDAHAGSPSTSGGYGPMHLMDVRAAARQRRAAIADGNARDDVAGPTRHVPEPAAAREALPESTLRRAAELTGLRPAVLRRDPAANISAGAALLASYQRRPSDDPAAWYDAVARYSGAGDQLTARRFADEVFSVIAEGATRRTDDGTVVRLTAVPGLRIRRPDGETATIRNAATNGGTTAGGDVTAVGNTAVGSTAAGSAPAAKASREAGSGMAGGAADGSGADGDSNSEGDSAAAHGSEAATGGWAVG
ncbi:hypothetical protein ABZ297_46885, partial [Nonomuraea sp. NPDC005983]